MSDTSNLRLRDATAGDLDAMLAVTLSAYQQYAETMGEEHWQGYRQNIESTIQHDEQAQRIIAEQAGAIVGSVVLYSAGTTFQIADGSTLKRERPEARLLAVAPAARGRGVGRALMEECARRAREAGAAVLTLHTTEMMAAAVRLYERLGFQRAPELDFHPGPGVIVMGYALRLG
jgi:ribosomal protein S18 acetylase RimI-like enzyme